MPARILPRPRSRSLKSTPVSNRRVRLSAPARNGAGDGASRNSAPKPERLLQLGWAYTAPIILDAALHFHLFDLLKKSARTVAELAAETGASPRGLAGLLDALVGLELLARKKDRYALTPESAAFLVSSGPAYHGTYFQHMVRGVLPGWLHLTDAVRTGKPVMAANQQPKGEEFFVELVGGLFPLSYGAAEVLGQHLRVPKANTPLSVLDLGAGSGVWGIVLAKQSPFVSVRAVDWPKVLEIAKGMAQRHGVAERYQTSAGDLLAADFGAGHRIATIGHILHSEGADRSRQLLCKTFAALAPGGTIAISEFVPNDDRSGPYGPLMFALNMLVHTDSGNTFTFKEIAAWLREAGFQNPRQLPAPAPSPLILATRP